ncbi:unnamed protein product [Pleuronectes platessa]|uniref:Uncharacterized protein n=1 Tax=Pleuronectes platessa TaxID=8262 RepID=A0A9N7U1R2_PLEPL|nr:unnamed protein product [Pleuronectes platessa]
MAARSDWSTSSMCHRLAEPTLVPGLPSEAQQAAEAVPVKRSRLARSFKWLASLWLVADSVGSCCVAVGRMSSSQPLGRRQKRRHRKLRKMKMKKKRTWKKAAGLS